MNQALVRQFMVPPRRLNSLLARGSCNRFSSTVSTPVTVDPSVLEPYDGSIVISGISGRFPSAVNTKELTEKILRGEELTSETSTRWDTKYLPERFGFLHCLDKFDANFFGFTPRQADQTDPQIRLLLEATFEAIIDAGMNPTEMRGSRTAVFCGAYGGEATDYSKFRANTDNAGYLGLSAVNFMIPARIAFALDLRGPSTHVCTACSSSFTALETAVHSIMRGSCDAAIVTGSTVHLNPQNHFDVLALQALSLDGRCKTFDESADGFARSEAAVAILVQREKDARRNYVRILNVRSNTDGYKPAGVMYPNRDQQERLLLETYQQVGINPATITYLETHGTGTPTGDPEELNSIHRVFCTGKERERPLMLGSVKSNMGHTEAAAGLCALAKVIGTVQTGTIPPNLFFNKPKPEEEHLFDGSMQVVTEPTPFDRSIIGVSSFGIGGTNYHCILEPGPIHQNTQHDLPILLPLSGRSAEQVEESIKEASEHAENPEYVHLLHNAYKLDISGNTCRGVGLIKPGEKECAITVESCDNSIRPVWIIFPGMGSQWNEMGKDLMKIDAFAESVQRARATLKNIGVDLDALLKPNNRAIFDDIHYAVLSITAMQMALYDTIKELGLQPEGFIGHSTGEFLCAYADGCFTAEETLLVTDARGRAFKESQKVIGCMASIGMSAEEVKARLPPGVELACNNAATNVTVSGEKDAVTKFVEQLKSEGKFAVVVNSCGIAAHSKHVQDAADLLKKYVVDIIKGDRVRTSRWISTSIPEAEWDSPLAKFASPDYFDNNLRAPVLFYEALQQVPARALVVEVSPKGFFQALLKETVPSDCVHVAPMTVKAEDKLSHFYQSVGQMFLSGADIHIDKLYPRVATPVSSNTPSLSHLVKWDHKTSWKTSILKYPMDAGIEVDVDLEHPKYAQMVGHKIENRILLPATGYLTFAYMHLSSNIGRAMEDMAVVYTNVVLRRATILSQQTSAKAFCTLNTASGYFQIENEGEITVSGNIKLLPEGESGPFVMPQVPSSSYLPLDKHDAYKEFKLRGYNYTGDFQGIEKIDNEGNWADITWTGSWVSFLDAMLQTSLLCTTSRNLAVPIDFERIIIDPVVFRKHLKQPEEGREHPLVRVLVLPNQNKIICPGVEFKGLQATIIPRRGQRGNLAYEKFTFCPFIENSPENMETHLSELVDLVLDNNRSKDLKVVDIFTQKENSLTKAYQHILTLKPLRESDVRMMTLTSEAEKMDEREKNVATLVTKEDKGQLVPEMMADLVFIDDTSLLNEVATKLKPAGFLLLQSSESVAVEVDGLAVVSKKILQDKELTLFRKLPAEEEKIIQVPVDSEGYAWVSELQETLQKPAEEVSRVYVTSQGNPTSGLLGFVNCLRQEDGGERIRCIFDPQRRLTLDFTNPNPELRDLISKDLYMNVFKSEGLGSYRHIPLEAETNGVVKTVEHAYISTLTPGDLSTLRWIESPLSNYKPTPPATHGALEPKKLYKVAYAAMNFRDVLLATATIPIEPEFSYKGSYLGYEFSGYDETGNRVMGISHGNGLASSVACDPRFVWKVPEQWTLEQAATVPVVYATVLYAFHTRGRVQPGHSVLIHAGTGGVGQAAISVALAHGCEVFTTVGTPEKREFIKKHFPQIKDDHIGNSRDTSFEAQFMEVTNGRGVDVALNSLAGDKLLATVRCIALNGKFLEIGVFDAFMNTPMGLRPFLKNIEFHGVELYHLMGTEISGARQLQKQMDDGISSGAIRPLPTHVFEKDQLEDAFRFMASGKHTGKLLIKVRDESETNVWKKPLNLPAVGRCYFSEDKAYLIVGGLGGLGLEVANWLVERGARNLVLTSRSGVTTGYQSLCLRKWKELGVTVETPTVDLSDRATAESFISELTSKREIAGIFNSALVLKDEVFSSQTAETFQEVSAPKATATQILDELSRKHCPNLDYFVTFSSSASGRGNAEQTNYGWANSVMERICENRMADGLHGLAIQWGVLGQVGVVAEKLLKDMDDNSELLGTLPQNVESCLEVLDVALQQKNPLVSSIVVAEKGKKGMDKAGLLARMQKIFGIKDIESINPDKKLSELGMDSLVAVELKQTLEREYDMTVTKELLLSMTVGDVKAIDAGTFDPTRVGKGAATSGIGGAAGPITPFKIHEEPLVNLKKSEGNPTIFIVHGLEGSADSFRPLADKLEANVYGFQFTNKFRVDSVETIAAGYLTRLKAAQPSGPYFIAGFSGGTPVAYEMARLLVQHNNDVVKKLILLDGCPTYKRDTGLDPQASYYILESMNGLLHVPDKRKEEFKESLTGDPETDANILLGLITEISGVQQDPKPVQSYLEFWLAFTTYDPPKRFNGEVVLVQAMDPSPYKDYILPNEDYNISKYCPGPVTRLPVKGDHLSFLSEGNVADTAKIVNSILHPT